MYAVILIISFLAPGWWAHSQVWAPLELLDFWATATNAEPGVSHQFCSSLHWG